MVELTGISEEQKEWITSLPWRSFKTGTNVVSGFYDESEGVIYLTNRDKELSGKVVKSTSSKESKPTAAPAADPTTTDDNDSEENTPTFASRLSKKLRKMAGADPDEEPEKKTTKSKKKESYATMKDEKEAAEDDEKQRTLKMKIIFGAGLIAVMAIVALVVLPHVIHKSIDPKPTENPAGNTDTALLSSATVAPEQIADVVNVLQAKRVILPGDKLTMDNVQSATISAADYNLICQTGNLLYLWEDFTVTELVENPDGKSKSEPISETHIRDEYYSTSFVDMGIFLSYKDVSKSEYKPINPWMRSDVGTKYVMIPIHYDELSQNTLFHYGTKFKLQINIPGDSSVTSPEGDGVEGLNITTSKDTLFTYTLDNVTLLDMCNKDGASLYTNYDILSQIPVCRQSSYLELLESSSLIPSEKFLPSYIIVEMTEAQLEKIGDLKKEGVTYSITFTEKIYFINNDMKDYSERVAVLMENIANVKANHSASSRS